MISPCSRRRSRERFSVSCPPPLSLPPNSDASESGMLSRLGDLLFYTIAEGQERIPIHKFTSVSCPLPIQNLNPLYLWKVGKGGQDKCRTPNGLLHEDREYRWVVTDAQAKETIPSLPQGQIKQYQLKRGRNPLLAFKAASFPFSFQIHLFYLLQ